MLPLVSVSLLPAGQAFLDSVKANWEEIFQRPSCVLLLLDLSRTRDQTQYGRTTDALRLQCEPDRHTSWGRAFLCLRAGNANAPGVSPLSAFRTSPDHGPARKVVYCGKCSGLC